MDARRSVTVDFVRIPQPARTARLVPHLSQRHVSQRKLRGNLHWIYFRQCCQKMILEDGWQTRHTSLGMQTLPNAPAREALRLGLEFAKQTLREDLGVF